MKPKILILEQEPIIAANLAKQFKKWDYSIFGVFENELDAFLSISCSKSIPVIVVMNLYSSKRATPFLIAELFQFLYNIPLLIITGLRKKEIITFLPRQINTIVLYKPYTPQQLKNKVSELGFHQ